MDVVKYNIGDIVYLKLNSELAGMITGILFRQGCVQYYVSWGNANETMHYDVELTNQKTFIEKQG